MRPAESGSRPCRTYMSCPTIPRPHARHRSASWSAVAVACKVVIDWPGGMTALPRPGTTLSEESALVSAFISGQELSRLFYEEAVRPILDATFPDVRHSAALLGRGSEVLGFDDEMSTDHDWKPRVLLFLREDDHARLAEAIREALSHQLPPPFGDQPTYCAILTLRGYVLEHLDFDI